jgi:hypothetical protein
MAIVLNGATSGNVTIDANAISGTSVITLPVGTGTFPLMNLSTAVATTSGTAIDFTSIPSWVKRITVMFSGVSTNGTSFVTTRLGTSAGIEATGYSGSSQNMFATNNYQASSITTGVDISAAAAANAITGVLVISNFSGNTFVFSGNVSIGGGGSNYQQGNKTLGGTLDRIRITTANGTDTFDAGSVNILMEGY